MEQGFPQQNNCKGLLDEQQPHELPSTEVHVNLLMETRLEW